MTSFAYAALWLFVFSVPCEDLLGVTAIGAGTRLAGMLALGLTLFATVISGRFRRLHAFHVAALLFVICAGVELWLFHSQERLPNKFGTYVQLLLVLWMIWELAPSLQRLLGLLTAYVFGAYVVAFGTILVYQRASGLRRFSVAGGDANDLAMTLALALPMAWYLGMTYRRPLLRWTCRAYLPIAVFAIALTGSRGGMLAGIVGLMIVPLSMTRLSPGRLVTAIAMLAISGALAVVYVPEQVVERLATTGTEIEELTLGGRFRVWKAGLNAFVAKPILGHGTSSFKPVVAPILGGEGKVAHNSFLSVLVEQGIVGLLLYSSMFAAVLVAVFKLPRLERRFALVLLGTLGVAMLPLTWEDRKQVWFILAALLGLSSAWVVRSGPIFSRPLRTAPVSQAPTVARRREPLTSSGRRADHDATA